MTKREERLLECYRDFVKNGANFDNLNSSCALRAVQIASGRDDMTVFMAFLGRGYAKHYGLGTPTMLSYKASKELGLEPTYMGADHFGGPWKQDRITLGRFLEEYPSGTYLVSSSQHLYVVHEGHVIDPYIGGRPRSRINRAIKLENANVQWKLEGTHMKFISVAGNGEARARRASGVAHWVKLKNEQGFACIEDVLQVSSYTKEDLEFDLKRGRIILA
jgi:hypothetical protein